MKLKNIILATIGLFVISISFAQKIELLSTGVKSSLRGLSVVNQNIIWASGSGGTVLKTTNGGISWQQIAVPNFEKRDFRDIEAFDSNTAIIMAIAEPAQILKTIDGGQNWTIVFTDSTKEMFLDAMFFKDEKNGIVVGDPINNKAFIATTSNAGNSWIKQSNNPVFDSGEAFFASSGSNVFLQKNTTFFVSGGKQSNLYTNNKKIELPINKGLTSTGANAISILKNNAIVVGGDFTKDSSTNGNCILYNIKTKKITVPNTLPSGYRSCVIQINKKLAFACGLNGVDISNDSGLNWKNISKEGFHIVAKSKNGNAVFFAGSKGKIGRLVN